MGGLTPFNLDGNNKIAVIFTYKMASWNVNKTHKIDVSVINLRHRTLKLLVCLITYT